MDPWVVSRCFTTTNNAGRNDLSDGSSSCSDRTPGAGSLGPRESAFEITMATPPGGGGPLPFGAPTEKDQHLCP